MNHADAYRQIVEKLTPLEQIRLANLIFASAAKRAPVDDSPYWSEEDIAEFCSHASRSASDRPDV